MRAAPSLRRENGDNGRASEAPRENPREAIQNNCRSLPRYEPLGWSWPLTIVERLNNQKNLSTLFYLLVLTEDLFSTRMCFVDSDVKIAGSLNRRTSFGCQELICAPRRSNALLIIYLLSPTSDFAQSPDRPAMAPMYCLARCSVSCATTKPSGQGRHLRVVRVAHKSCVALEGPKGSMVCPIYACSSAERAS